MTMGIFIRGKDENQRRTMISLPRSSRQVRTEVMETPKRPWRFRLWPVKRRFFSGVRGDRMVRRGVLQS